MIQYESENKYKITVECGVINGKRKRKSKTIIGSYEEAQKVEHELLNVIKDSKVQNENEDEILKEYKEEKKLTFEKLANLYLKEYCELNLKKNTIYGYKNLLNVILKEIGYLEIDKVTPFVLQQFYNSLKRKNDYSSNTLRHYYVLINSIFERARKWQLIDNNPNSCIDKPKLDKKDASIYDYEQLKLLFDALDKESIVYKAPIILCFDSGMRREELNGLKWNNVNFETNEIFIEEIRIAVGKEIVVTTPKTVKSKRKIMVSQHTMECLKELKAYQDKSANLLGDKWANTNYVFVNEMGLPYYPDTISKMFKRIQKKYNLDSLTLHQLRHTNASLLLNKKEDIAIISARLGHSNVATTLSIYSHALECSNVEVANTMNSILENL